MTKTRLGKGSYQLFVFANLFNRFGLCTPHHMPHYHFKEKRYLLFQLNKEKNQKKRTSVAQTRDLISHYAVIYRHFLSYKGLKMKLFLDLATNTLTLL